MVTAGFAISLLVLAGGLEPPIATSPPDQAAQAVLGAVRVARGKVTLRSGDAEPIQARSGDLLRAQMTLETSPSGWAEALVLDAGRLRLSASTRLSFGKGENSGALRLQNGRIWIQATGRGDVQLVFANARAWIARGSSVIVEYTRTTGGSIAVREGAASLEPPDAESGRVQLARGRVATWLPDARSTSPARAGGLSIGALAAQEARDGLGDLIGLKAFLLERSTRAEVSGVEPRRTNEILRSTPEITGSDTGAAGMLVEEGLRPPPFFESEVPPKGPNARVEVTYGD